MFQPANSLCLLKQHGPATQGRPEVQGNRSPTFRWTDLGEVGTAQICGVLRQEPHISIISPARRDTRDLPEKLGRSPLQDDKGSGIFPYTEHLYTDQIELT